MVTETNQTRSHPGIKMVASAKAELHVSENLPNEAKSLDRNETEPGWILPLGKSVHTTCDKSRNTNKMLEQEPLSIDAKNLNSCVSDGSDPACHSPSFDTKQIQAEDGGHYSGLKQCNRQTPSNALVCGN